MLKSRKIGIGYSRFSFMGTVNEEAMSRILASMGACVLLVAAFVSPALGQAPGCNDRAAVLLQPAGHDQGALAGGVQVNLDAASPPKDRAVGGSTSPKSGVVNLGTLGGSVTFLAASGPGWGVFNRGDTLREDFAEGSNGTPFFVPASAVKNTPAQGQAGLPAKRAFIKAEGAVQQFIGAGRASTLSDDFEAAASGSGVVSISCTAANEEFSQRGSTSFTVISEAYLSHSLKLAGGEALQRSASGSIGARFPSGKVIQTGFTFVDSTVTDFERRAISEGSSSSSNQITGSVTGGSGSAEASITGGASSSGSGMNSEVITYRGQVGLPYALRRSSSTGADVLSMPPLIHPTKQAGFSAGVWVWGSLTLKTLDETNQSTLQGSVWARSAMSIYVVHGHTPCSFPSEEGGAGGPAGEDGETGRGRTARRPQPGGGIADGRGTAAPVGGAVLSGPRSAGIPGKVRAVINLDPDTADPSVPVYFRVVGVAPSLAALGSVATLIPAGLATYRDSPVAAKLVNGRVDLPVGDWIVDVPVYSSAQGEYRVEFSFDKHFHHANTVRVDVPCLDARFLVADWAPEQHLSQHRSPLPVSVAGIPHIWLRDLRTAELTDLQVSVAAPAGINPTWIVPPAVRFDSEEAAWYVELLCEEQVDLVATVTDGVTSWEIPVANRPLMHSIQ